MDALTTTVASGLRSRMEALDLVANNLANSSAPGYKADRSAFSTYLADEAAAENAAGASALSPVIENNWTDYGQGEIRRTGNTLDVALSGKGFFLAQSAGGPLLTRGGSLVVTQSGRLTTPDGYALEGVDGRPIDVDPARPVEIQADGRVMQGGATVAQLRVVQPPDTGALQRREGLYFSLDSRGYQSLTQSGATVMQGSLEGSNFGPADSSVRMITVLRQFEALQKAAQVSSDMGRRVTEDVARVHG